MSAPSRARPPLSARRAALLRDGLPLAVIIGVAGTAAAVFALQLSEYLIMPDELGYVKQGIALSHADLPTPGDFWFNSWALLRPLMLAVPYRLWATPDAFDISHVIGAFVMASAAVPAYLLARRVVASRVGALLVAALTVAVPWTAMAGTMMTEVVAYPAFVWACLAMHNGIRRPGLRGDAIVAAALGLAFVARTQLLVLAPAYACALGLDALLRRDDGPLRRHLANMVRAHAALFGAALLGLLAVVATGSVRRLLGGYAEPAHGALFPPGTAAATRELVVYVVLAIGAVPLAASAAWAALTAGRRDVTRDDHAFAALLVSVVAILIVVGGSFTIRFTAGINDRYLFYVGPLLFAGMAAALARPPRRLAPALVVTGAVTAWLIGSSAITQRGPSLVSPSAPWHGWLAARAADVGLSMPHLAGLGAAVAVTAVALGTRFARPPVVLGTACSLLLAWGVVQTAYAFDQVAATQEGVSALFLKQRNWIDRALPANARAIAVIASVGDPPASAATWWDTSFWNKSVDRVVTVGSGNPFGQNFHDPLTVDPETGRVPALDRYQYVVRYANDTRFGLRGSNTVANFGGILVLTANRPYQAEWLFTGPDPDQATVSTGKSANLRAFAPRGEGPGVRRVAVTLAVAGSKPVPVELAADGQIKRARIAPGERATLELPARYTAAGHADLLIDVRKYAPPGSVVTLIGVNQM